MTPPVFAPRRLQLARWAVAAIFFGCGAGFAGWAARIPAVQERLGLGAGALGAALWALAGGSLLGMPLAGRWCARAGSRWPTVGLALGFCATLPLPGFAWNQATLTVALAVLGFFCGGLDVSMNTHAVAVERAGGGRPILSGLHGMFSLGAMVGAGVGGLAAFAGIGAGAQLTGTGLVLGAATLLAARALLPAAVDRRPTAPAPVPESWRERWPLRPRLLLLGGVGFCALLAEGAMLDWSAVFLRRELGAAPALAAVGYGAFSATMAAGRLLGDRVTAALGPVNTLRLGGAAATAGLALTVTAEMPWVGLTGCALTGLGLANGFPVALRAAGRMPGLSAGGAVAVTTALGYGGLLAGPPVIGGVAEAFGGSLRVGLGVALAAGVVGWLLSPVAREEAPHPTDAGSHRSK